jgi:SAM-dependent methyltransferase
VKPYADHFSRVASEYASRRPGYPDELFAYLAGLVSRRELAWDCAAGSGQATLPLARWFEQVVGTDASPEMLSQAPAHPRIQYRVARAEQSGLSSASVDLVTVAQALHWLEPDLFYSEVERVLIPEGVIAVWTYGRNHLDDESLDRVLQQFYEDIVGPYWPAERCHVEAGYRTLPFPFPELVPPSFAMEVEWSLSELLGYVGTWSASQRFREVEGHDPVQLLASGLAGEWGAPDRRRRITWPLSTRVGRR